MTIHRPDAPTPESDEHYVREVIDSAMSGSRPSHDLTAGALAHGRRLRTRRRVAVACSAVAATVLAAVAAPLVLAGAGPSARDGSDMVATQPPAPTPRAPEGWWDMPALDMVNAVGAIVPDSVAVTDLGPLEADTPEGGPATGWINPTLMAPGGPGRLNVMLYPDPAHSVTLSEGDGTVIAPTSGSDPGCEAPELSTATSCVEVPAGEEVEVEAIEPDRLSCDEEHQGRTRCTQILDDAGDVVGRRLTSRWGGTVMYEVVLRRDGGTIYAASANTLDDKWGADSPLSADRPPLTLDQLEDLVRNDVWVSYRR
jgi:hypothetical protein